MSDIDQEAINNMVIQLLAVPNGKSSEGEVIIAFAKAVAVVARMIGDRPGGHYDADEVLEDMFELIEDYFDQQDIVTVEEFYEH